MYPCIHVSMAIYTTVWGVARIFASVDTIQNCFDVFSSRNQSRVHSRTTFCCFLASQIHFLGPPNTFKPHRSQVYVIGGRNVEPILQCESFARPGQATILYGLKQQNEMFNDLILAVTGRNGTRSLGLRVGPLTFSNVFIASDRYHWSSLRHPAW